jgi:acyl carrier protein
LGATVRVLSIDVGDAASLAALFEQFGKTEPSLRGVIHAAGALTPAFIKDMTLDTLQATFRAKVRGSWILHQLTQGMKLDFFVLFSSGASVWGSKTLAHHAAANLFMDMLAYHRHSLGLPALSINWGWWAGGGTEAELEALLAQVGLAPMSAEQALNILEYLLETDSVQKTVAAINWKVFKQIYEAKRPRPFLEKIEAISQNQLLSENLVPTNGLAEGPKFIDRLTKALPHERPDLLLSYVQTEVARVLGLESNQLDLKEGLFQMGMDSLMAVELKSRLEAGLGCALPSTLTFDYPTIEALTAYLAREIIGLDSSKKHQPVLPENDKSPDLTEIEPLSPDDVKALLDEELTAIDQLLGENEDE